MKATRLLNLIVFLICSLSTFASSERWKSVVDSMHIDFSKVKKSLVLDSVIPYDSTKSMLAIPIKQDSAPTVFDLHIILFDNSANKIMTHYVDSSKIFITKQKDVSAIRFDFANFKLNNTTRAFGIRITDSLSSNVFMIKNEFITLYVTENNKTKKVMDNVLISSTTDQWNLQNCEGDHFTETKIMVMSRRKKKLPTDYRDIIIKNHVVSVKNFIKRTPTDTCKTIDTHTTHRDTILKQKIDIPNGVEHNAIISFNDGDVVTLGDLNTQIMHDKMNDIEQVNADSIAKMLDDEKTKKQNMNGEELDIYKLEQVSTDENCIESTTTEWLREYYIYKNGEYVLSEEPKK